MKRSISLFHALVAGTLALSAVLVGIADISSAAAKHNLVYAWVGSWGGTGGDNQSWNDGDNWSPVGVPTTGDSVVVDAAGAICQIAIQGVPAGISLHRLFIGEDSGCTAQVSGGTLSVTRVLTWTGGTIDAPATIAAGARARLSGPGVDRQAPDGLTVSGTLDLDQASIAVPAGLVVADGGRLAGSGIIDGSVTNGGTVTAGSSVSDGPQLAISGDYMQPSTGVLLFHVPGPYDALRVSGTATVEGQVVYQTARGQWTQPPFGARALEILSSELVWDPACQMSTGPFRKDGHWFAVHGFDFHQETYYVKIKFKTGASRPC